MSAASPTKIFGIRIGIDPKILIGGLVALAALLFWFNSRSDDSSGTSAPATAARPAAGTPFPQSSVPAGSSRATVTRRTNNAANEHGRLRLRPIDATRGDVDPTLRLDLLSRLQSVKAEPSRRSLFEIGAVPASVTSPAASIKNAPVIHPGPVQPPQPTGPVAPPPVSIPLKYYGFVKPMEPGQVNRGFFLDGDNVLVASEGQVLKQRYLVVELGPNTAKLEDTQMKQGQTLPVMPAALPQ